MSWIMTQILHFALGVSGGIVLGFVLRDFLELINPRTWRGKKL